MMPVRWPYLVALSLTGMALIGAQCRIILRSEEVRAAGDTPIKAVTTSWPQFRGPNRDGISSETDLLKRWPKGGPPLVWTYTNAGLGYSGPAIVGDRLYIAGGRDGDEYVYALDLTQNPPKEIWAVKIGPNFTWKGNMWNEGPIATPTVDGDRLYALGGQGVLICVNTTIGREEWRKDLPKDLAAEVDPVGGGPEKIGWGFAWAPLVDGDHLICVPGGKQGTVAALDKKTGHVIWRSKQLTDQASYASPILAEVEGIRQYIVFTNKGVYGISARNGDLLWSHLRKKPYDDIVASTPLFRESMVYITAGAGGGCDLIKLTAGGQKVVATPVYSNDALSNLHGGVVLVADYVYGHSDGPGWTCMEFKNGAKKWAEKQYLNERGSITYADGRLYLYGERTGKVMLIEASPGGWKAHGQFEIPQKSTRRKPRGGTWTHPVICNGKLYLRDQENLFCYKLQG